jgi:hypothetical protein
LTGCLAVARAASRPAASTSRLGIVVSHKDPTSPHPHPLPLPAAGNFALDRIVEVKRTLSGQEKRFACTVLAREGSHLIVLFVAAAAMHVHGVDLPAGTVTFGHFWTDRPYNVYHWLDGVTGSTIGYYVNLSDSTSIGEGSLEWRDLIVDVLLMPDGRATVLDEDEIRADVPSSLRLQIADARATVLGARLALIAELERNRAALWPPPPLVARKAR